MAQPFNLNVNPYFEDFNALDDYYQVLFRPGRPIQARELNNLQAGLQNQIGSLASANYKEGQVVVPGATGYNQYYDCVQLNNSFFGISISNYIDQLLNKVIVGTSSGITARVRYILSSGESINNNTTIYIQYITASPTNFSSTKFEDGETLELVNDSVTYGGTVIPPLTPLASLISSQAIQSGSAFFVNDGIYFIRNYLVRCASQTILLDQYSNFPSYRIGFSIQQRIVTAFDDENLTDNAQGFNNYAAPGADRFQLNLILTKKPLDDFNDIDFVELARVINGVLQVIEVTTEVPWRAELARRTFDESGNYYVRQFEVNVKESLNDLVGNNGIYLPGQQTSSGLTPSPDLMVYNVSPGKAYVQGYEVEKNVSTFIDAPKPRTTESVEEITVPFQYSNSFTVNNIEGTPPVGNPGAYIEIYSNRKGTAGISTIGLARVYDFKYPNGYQDEASTGTIDFYDVQIFTSLILSSNPTGLTQTAYFVGANSGATGYLYSSNTTTREVVLYQTTGNFVVGEPLIINGVGGISGGSYSNITITDIENYNATRSKSVSYTSGTTGTFSADLVLDVPVIPAALSSQYTITTAGASATLTGVGNDFASVIFVGDIVSYSISGNTLPTYNVVTAINQLGNQLTLAAVPSVADVCDGDLPTGTINVNDLVILRAQLVADFPNLFAILPKQTVVSVATTSSIVYERYQVTGNVTSNTLTISAPTGKTFQPFNSIDYSLSYSDGTVEILTSQKVSINPTGTTIFFAGLSRANANNVLVDTVLVNSEVNSKIKTLNRSTQLIIDGSNVNNDEATLAGLTYKPAYGTRVQDNQISLNVCDVLNLKAVFESQNSADPVLPSIQVASITPSVSRIIIGEKFRGETSLAVATVVATDPVNQLVSFVLDNNNSFKIGEVISFYESSVVATVNNSYDGSVNVTKNYTLNNGQTATILDYGRLVLNPTAQPAKNKLLVVFDYYTLNPNDSGTFVTQSSYAAYEYILGTPYLSTASLTDVIDLRPRVSPYTFNVLNPRSPFEFLARNYNNGTNSASNVIIAGESIVVGLTYYLPRIDCIFLDATGKFEVRSGTPSENPQPPLIVNDAIKLATINLPAYLTNTRYASVNVAEYKRYQMKDISKLETRISNLEFYTNLSLLESTTLSVAAKDPQTGLDRFKSGFFVDNFRTHNVQDITNPEFRAASDAINGQLRPSHYTTSIDLLLGSYSVLGIGTIPQNQVDLSDNLTDLIGANIQKTGDLITLAYTETVFAEQNFATRIENVTPFLVVDYVGNVVLTPNSDTWIDTTALEANNIELEGDYQALLDQFGADAQTGLAPIDWGAWETNWIGVNVNASSSTVVTGTSQQRQTIPGTRNTLVTNTTTTQTNSTVSVGVDLGQTRTGTQTRITPRFENADFGNRVVSRDLLPFMRSRNLQFVAKGLKPSIQHYVFYDNVNMNAYVVPKLVEIAMAENSPAFTKGETVVGILPSSFAVSAENQEIPFISFRLAQSNHKYGNYLEPSEVYVTNPYAPSVLGTPNIIPADYTTTSTTLNVDTESLQTQAQGGFFGYLVQGMILVGQTSQASAQVTNVRILSDSAGVAIGSLYFPEPNQIGTPTFLAGSRTFKLSSSPTNSIIPGDVSSVGTAVFYSQGQIDTTQETTLSIRFGDVSVERGFTESRVISGSDSATFVSGTGSNTSVSVSPPPPRVDPLAQTFYVDSPTPIYITSVDCYFKSRDDGNLPVICELRTTANGYPTDVVLPFGTVVLDPDQVNLSDDGTVPTKFSFPSPVILNGNGALYAIVLKSVSQGYTAWCARMGEIDITTINKPDSEKIIVGNQPATGDLFKSGNGSTWIADGYEDLKFNLYRAQFSTTPGSVNFYNPELGEGNNQIINLKKNPFEMFSRNEILTFPSNITNLFGIKLYQTISATGETSEAIVQEQNGIINNVSIQFGGVGFVTGTYTGVGITAITGTGNGGTADIVVGAGGTITSFTITNGGSGYSVNDNITVINAGTLQFGSDFVGIVSSLSSQNSITITDATSNFNVIDSVYYFDPLSGIQQSLGVPVSVVNGVNDGLHIKVSHGNHGMNDIRNYVTLADAQTSIAPEILTVGISTFTSTISVSDAVPFGTFEGQPVSTQNPGYVIIDQEVISYTGISTNTLLGTITRGVDGTIPIPHVAGTKVYTYQMNGISLRRINRTFQLDDAIESGQYYPQLDYYYVKIDTTSNGTNRTDLYCTTSGTFGGENVLATQNIQFSTITPNIQVLAPTGTAISSRIRTVTGTSVGANQSNLQPSFIAKPYIDVNNQAANDLPVPALVASQVNENAFTSDLLGKKSFNLEMGLFTSSDTLSPCIDLTRLGCILTDNRLDNQIQAFNLDARVNSLVDDPSAAIYISKPINLKNPATTLQVLVAANRAATSDFRVLYRIFTNDSQNENQGYQLFPGYNNLDGQGRVINPRNNDGSADAQVASSLQGEFLDYQFTASNLPSFTAFVIKIVMVGTNQANPPILRDLRAIALA